jgi:DDE superfamily endonuclease
MSSKNARCDNAVVGFAGGSTGGPKGFEAGVFGQGATGVMGRGESGIGVEGFGSELKPGYEIGVAAERHEVGGRLNNRVENSHQPFWGRERATQRFRSPKTLQKFSSVHAQVHNQFNQERHLVTRQVYKQRRSAALAEWRALGA